MEKVDLKDRKILYNLMLDSRQSFNSIGKKVGLHKDVVAYRINKLQEKGIIKNFYSAIDVYKLGYTIFRFYLTYQYANPDIKKEITEYFIKSKFANIIHTVEGTFDLVVFTLVKDLNEFYYFWDKSLNKYAGYFANQKFSIFFQEYFYGYSFLLDEKIDRKKAVLLTPGKRVEIDDFDSQILDLIIHNSRIPTIEIAEKLNLNTVTIKNRIKKLMDLGVIQGFRVDIDFSKLGYKWFKIDINLTDHKKIPQVLKYVESNPHFVAIDRSIGYVNVELEFYLKTVDQVHEIMDDVTQKFPNVIKNYNYFSVIKSNKIEITTLL